MSPDDAFSNLCISSTKSLSPPPRHLSQSTTTTTATTTTGGSSSRCLLLYYETHNSMTESYSLYPATDTDFSSTKSTKLKIPFQTMHGFLRIVGSCQGLVCLFDSNFFSTVGTIIFWNPSIQTFKFAEHPKKLTYTNTYSHVIIGFGFVSKINDFKIVQILYESLGNDYSQTRCNVDSAIDSVSFLDSLVLDVLVYSMGNETWRKIEAIAPCYIPKGWSSNVNVNGCLNWLAFKEKPKLKEEGKFDCIMAFDLEDEVFRVISFPKECGVMNYDHIWLFSSGFEQFMKLTLFILYKDKKGDRLETWTMNEYGVAESWTKEDSITFSRSQVQVSAPLGFKRNGEVFLAVDNDFGKLMLYKPKEKTIIDLEVRGVPSSFCIVDYVPSF